jgi:hypothetical protein
MIQPGRRENLFASFPGKGSAGVLAPHASLRFPGGLV